jgi:alkanesulfonate monooxygenase SsuD/methylene tetrahydromethanopterin reductase-like flavin-dependent oxidoreductase (luciferase family)
MQIGMYAGRELGFSADDRARLGREGKRLGYTAIWTNSGANTTEVDMCSRWFDETGLPTGTAVIATPTMDLARLAAKVKPLHEKSGGTFTLGIGSGGMTDPRWRAENNLADRRPIEMMREHVTYLKREAGAPVYLAAMGPNMLELAGELADGILPNWMDPEHLAWAREQMAVGARKAGRPTNSHVVQAIRTAVDDDPVVARRALAAEALRYVFARPGQPGGGHYHASARRMGVGPDIDRAQALKDAGAPEEEWLDSFPESSLERMGAWGRPAEAAARVRKLAEGFDLVNVRPVLSRPNFESAVAPLEACAGLLTE